MQSKFDLASGPFRIPLDNAALRSLEQSVNLPYHCRTGLYCCHGDFERARIAEGSAPQHCCARGDFLDALPHVLSNQPAVSIGEEKVAPDRF
jgi:hypothetical protein